MSDFSDLEAELKQLRPAAPSAELLARVERALSEAPATSTPTAGILPRSKVRVSWFALGFGVAAAAALFMLARVDVDPASQNKPALAAITPLPRIATAQIPAGLVPDGLTRVVYNTRDEGLVYPADASEPVRRIRSRSRETLKWQDRATGASLRVSYPTEEVELIPVAGQ